MRTILFAAALAAFLLASTADPSGLLAFLANPWGGESQPAIDHGCIMDPDGRCAAGGSQATVDHGCIMDPSGCPWGE